MELSTMQQRAMAKAVEAGLPAKVKRIAFGHYEVPSTSREGKTHTVRHTRGIDGEAALVCSCEGGSRPVCVHRAALYVRRLQEQGVRVTAVKAPATLKPAPARHPRKQVVL